jgi:hypothetical protein
VGRVMLPVLVRILSPSLETMIVFCAPKSMPTLAILLCFWKTAAATSNHSSTTHPAVGREKPQRYGQSQRQGSARIAGWE